MASLDELESFIREKVAQAWTHSRISEHLQTRNPGIIIIIAITILYMILAEYE